MTPRAIQTNTAARIERLLTVAILRGDHPPGSHLPTVRALALAHGINPSTAQRVIARLESSGLVTVKRGSGVRVNDPHKSGDLSLLPSWLNALADEPPRAAAMLRDYLEVRRIVAARLIVRHRQRLIEAADRLLGAASALLAAPKDDIEALREADLGFARALLKEIGNGAAATILNAASRILIEVPEVSAAMYAEPDTNAASIHKILLALQQGGEESRLSARVEEAIAEVDAGTVSRFEAILEARRTQP